ncbi:Uncharacterized protein TCM_034027 [Theobroma cacao]|uniref:Uncharacterized protein n=1 Tax=Theobroma cacao TaxID=3641 RepID=A0A061FJU1_THECC|nr:Uncharacterized protein TCM_034027 [Theobroma cacao]
MLSNPLWKVYVLTLLEFTPWRALVSHIKHRMRDFSMKLQKKIYFRIPAERNSFWPCVTPMILPEFIPIALHTFSLLFDALILFLLNESLRTMISF